MLVILFDRGKEMMNLVFFGVFEDSFVVIIVDGVGDVDGWVDDVDVV